MSTVDEDEWEGWREEKAKDREYGSWGHGRGQGREVTISGTAGRGWGSALLPRRPRAPLLCGAAQVAFAGGDEKWWGARLQLTGPSPHSPSPLRSQGIYYSTTVHIITPYLTTAFTYLH